MEFSANLGFLLTELALPEAIARARLVGFKAVELHWPYATPADTIRAALADSRLPVLALNTLRGDTRLGENGLCALAGRESEARQSIDQAIDYGRTIGARFVHVMAGRQQDGGDIEVYGENLRYASQQAHKLGMSILIEPLNPIDAPGYMLHSLEQAQDLLLQVGAPNLKIMFDCYHLSRMGYDLASSFKSWRGSIGHVQFAAVPDRAEPDHGDVDFSSLLPRIAALGFAGPFGAEYKPVTASFDWLEGLCSSN